MLQISLRKPAGLLISLLTGTMLLGQTPKPSPSEAPKPSPSAKEEKGTEFEPPPPVVTEHSLTLSDGKTLRYKAITGYLLLRDTVTEQNQAQDEQSEDAEPEAGHEPKKNEKPVDPTKGKPKAQVFFVAYVAEDSGDAGCPTGDIRFQRWTWLVVDLVASRRSGPAPSTTFGGRRSSTATSEDRGQ